MATVAAVIASTHHPFYYRASTSEGTDRPPFADEWAAKIEAYFYDEPLAFQREFAARLSHWTVPYPDIST